MKATRTLIISHRNRLTVSVVRNDGRKVSTYTPGAASLNRIMRLANKLQSEYSLVALADSLHIAYTV